MTEENSSRAFYTVSGSEQARLLTEPVSKEFFKPFLAREKTASQAARELGCKLNTLLYRVNAFLKAGLLEVSRVEARAGRAIKHYRSAHDAYFIPFDLTPYAEVEERLKAQFAPFSDRLMRSLAKAYRDNAQEGQRLYRGAEGTVWTVLAAAEEGEAAENAPKTVALFSDIVVRLTQVEAEALRQTLETFLESTHAKPSHPEAKGYTLQVALTPYEL